MGRTEETARIFIWLFSMMDLKAIARALGGEVSSGQVKAPGPGHSAADRSLSIKIDANAPDGFIVHSFAGDDPITCKDYVRSKLGLPTFKPNGGGKPNSGAGLANDEDRIAKAMAAAMAAPRAKPKGTVVATYDYTDEEGALLYQVLRYEPKNFSQRRPNGNGGYIDNLDGVRRVLYRRQDLLKYPDATVFFCEGEKDADRVASLDHIATTVAHGKWTDECVQTLAGRDILILEDNDKAGRKTALEAATLLHGVANTVRIVRLPDLPEKGDVSDWLDVDPKRASKLADICFDTPLWGPDASAVGASNTENTSENTKHSALTFFDQLTQPTVKPWLIKNVIARGETSSWFAPPGRGKSALLTDIGVHLAGAVADWRGYRIKGRCGVIYFALERADLVKRRLIAHKLRDGLLDLPIAVCGQVIDLMDRGCVQWILDMIKQAEQHFQRAIGLAVFDTYAKAIAAGGGDESTARDQNIALANLRRVLDRVDIHIAGIGHTGKDESRGERGSNAREADVDLMVQITGDTIKTATVKKANDQPMGEMTSFRLEPLEFGLDEDGDPFGTYILSKEIFKSVGAERPLSDKQRLAIDALIETTLAHGQPLSLADGLPKGLKSVTADQWKAELFRRNVIDQDARNPRSRFNELRTSLAAKKLIGVRDELVWLAMTETKT